jgi:hypothetical protein
MKNFFAHIKSIITDGRNGSLSSKRIVTVLCVLMMIIGFVGNMFFGFNIAEHIYNAIMYVVVTGLGMTGLEKFAPPSGPSDPSN